MRTRSTWPGHAAATLGIAQTVIDTFLEEGWLLVRDVLVSGASVDGAAAAYRPRPRRLGAFWNAEVERLQYGAFVGTNGKAGWNSVVLTVNCPRNIQFRAAGPRTSR